MNLNLIIFDYEKIIFDYHGKLVKIRYLENSLASISEPKVNHDIMIFLANGIETVFLERLKMA